MPPPAKRPRSNSEEGEEPEASRVDPTAPESLKPYEELWFEDGNIVLSTDVHLYCVHRGVLAKNSSVFRDMLGIPGGAGDDSPGTSGSSDVSGWTSDTWEGKPLVKMVGDRDEDVMCILKALYDREFYTARRPTTLPIIKSLLVMSTKYDVASVLKEVSEHLSAFYPVSLDAMLSRRLDALYIDSGNLSPTFNFELLAIVLQCNITTVLPVLFLECACFHLDIEAVIDACSSLDSVDRSRIVRIHQKLTRLTYSFAFGLYAVGNICDSNNCVEERLGLFKAWMSSGGIFPAPPPTPIIFGERKPFSNNNNVCKACVAKSTAQLENFKKKFWAKLPALAGLGSWEDINVKSLSFAE